jgi:hypothetical protein
MKSSETMKWHSLARLTHLGPGTIAALATTSPPTAVTKPASPNKARAGHTHHKVPSTSNTIPFNFGNPSASLPSPAPSGANRLGSLDNLVVIINVLIARDPGVFENMEGLEVLANS